MYAETSIRHHSDTATLARSLRWFDAGHYLPGELPVELKPWLLAGGSLTRHLIAASDGDFRVQRLAQDWRRPTLSEARLLDLDPARLALIREVILWGRGQPWVYGRSVLPAHSLDGELRRLRRLQDSSLGALLFRYPHLQRTPFQLARVDACALRAGLRSNTPLWGRRSRFALARRTLIVGEIFLDPFVHSAAIHRHP